MDLFKYREWISSGRKASFKKVTTLYTRYRAFLWVLPLAAPAVFVFLFLADKTKINSWELRMYLLYFFIFLGVAVFGILRLYNAVVVNSSYLGATKKSVGSATTAIDNLERTIKNSGIKSSLGAHAQRMEKIMRDFNDAVRDSKRP